MTAHHTANERKQALKVEVIECAHHGIPRRRELEDDESCATTEHAMDLPQRGIQIIYVANAERHDRAANAASGQGKIQNDNARLAHVVLNSFAALRTCI